MAFTKYISVIAFAFIVVGGTLGVVSLFAGPWVEGTTKVSGSDSGTISASCSLQPGQMCVKSAAGDNSAQGCFSASQIEKSWSNLGQVLKGVKQGAALPEGVNGASTATLVSNTYNLVAAGAVGCAACVVLYLPFFLRELRGGVEIVQFCGKWTSIIGGAAAGVGAVLLLAAYGAMAESGQAQALVTNWDIGTVKSGDSSLEAQAGFSAVMDCAAAAGSFALMGALLIIARAIVCRGDEGDSEDAGYDVVDPASASSNPFR